MIRKPIINIGINSNRKGSWRWQKLMPWWHPDRLPAMLKVTELLIQRLAASVQTRLDIR
jgi:hypothetical protein